MVLRGALPLRRSRDARAGADDRGGPKRLVIAGLAIGVVMAVLVGCGSTTDSSAEQAAVTNVGDAGTSSAASSRPTGIDATTAAGGAAGPGLPSVGVPPTPLNTSWSTSPMKLPEPAATSSAADPPAPVAAAESSTPAAAASPSAADPAPVVTQQLLPGQGDISSTVPEIAVRTAAAVPLTATAGFGNQVVTAVTGIRAVTAKPVGPGELAGPAVAVTIAISNGSASSISLESIDVALTDSAGSPGVASSGDPAAPVAGDLAPGAKATGTYVFAVDQSLRNPVTISIGYSDIAAVVSFVGNAG